MFMDDYEVNVKSLQKVFKKEKFYHNFKKCLDHRVCPECACDLKEELLVDTNPNGLVKTRKYQCPNIKCQFSWEEDGVK
jgi:hypothetical protein